MEVKVRKISADPWSKLKKYNNCTTKICVGLDSVGELKTGLDSEGEKMWEKKLGYAPGTLAKTSPFWADFFIPIELELRLNDEEPLHAFWLHILKQKKIVAQSLEEIKTNSKAEFVIFSEEHEAREKNIERKSKKHAFAKFNTMTTEDMKNFLVAIGHKPYNMNAEVLEDTVGKIVEDKPKFFLEIVENPSLNEIIFLNTLVNVGILTTRGNAYIWGKTTLGNVDQAITWLHNKENSELVASLKVELKAKIKGK